jgi:hypothetical protein
MKHAVVIAGIVLAVAGCAQFEQQFGQQEAALSKPIATSELDWARKSGRNTVSGLAVMKAGGEQHTCAGQSANLIPDSAYARARMTAIFGNADRGMRAASRGAVKFERDDPLYVSTLRTTRCDAQGSFSFPQVPDGVWYATTSVKWQGASQVEGGSMMQRVDVRGGRLVKVTMP